MKPSLARTWNATRSKMFPHIFAVFQLTLLIFGLMPFADFPIIVAGRADHAFKVIMPFHLWMLVFSITLLALFYRIRGEGIEEKCITTISFVAATFSALNLGLHFTDNHILWMRITENTATTLYLTVPMIGLYKISNVFLLPLIIRRFRKSRRRQDG